MALSVPFQEVMAFPKLAKAYFAFFEVLFRNHINSVLSLGTPVFLQVIQAQHDGLQSVGKSSLLSLGAHFDLPSSGKESAALFFGVHPLQARRIFI